MSNDNYCSLCQVEFHRGRDLHNCIGRVRCGIVKVRARRIPEEEQHFWTLPVSACPPASIWPPMAGSRDNSPKFAAPTPNFFIISLPVQYSQIHCCFLGYNLCRQANAARMHAVFSFTRLVHVLLCLCGMSSVARASSADPIHYSLGSQSSGTAIYYTPLVNQSKTLEEICDQTAARYYILLSMGEDKTQLPAMSRNITSCQEMGKKVLLEIFATGQPSDEEATQAAQGMWSAFGPPGTLSYSQRPYGNATIDGFHIGRLPIKDPFDPPVSYYRSLRKLMQKDTSRSYSITQLWYCDKPVSDDVLSEVDKVFVSVPHVGSETSYECLRKLSSKLGSGKRLYVNMSWVPSTSITRVVCGLRSLALPNFGGAWFRWGAGNTSLPAFQDRVRRIGSELATA